MLALAALLLSTPAPAGALDKAKDAVGLETPAAAPALPEPTYWFNPTETLIFRDQLYYSAFANHLREGQRLTLTLEGPGAPAEPLVSVTARKDDEDFSERWLSFSSGGLGANKQGLPIEGLSAGDYTLRMRVDGAEVAAQPFALIEVPTALGATALQVDPRERAWRPYVTGPYVLMWVPVDLTMGLEAYRAYWWADGEYLGDTVTAPEVPRLSLGASELGDVPLFSLAPVVLRKKQDVGALDVALSHNEADVLGAARWVNTWDPRVVEGVDPGHLPRERRPARRAHPDRPEPEPGRQGGGRAGGRGQPPARPGLQGPPRPERAPGLRPLPLRGGPADLPLPALAARGVRGRGLEHLERPPGPPGPRRHGPGAPAGPGGHEPGRRQAGGLRGQGPGARRPLRHPDPGLPRGLPGGPPPGGLRPDRRGPRRLSPDRARRGT
ncbi:MAG: hypothetical protein H6740_13095 [Alphaproteobacteria bacterium]|nr:hypothetical protein [Alphaproteobacteria bacterium]